MEDPGRIARMRELEVFFSVSPDLLCIADFNAYFLEVNPAWEKTIGYSKDELRALKYIEFVHPEDREQTLAVVEALTKDSTVRSHENRYLCKDGTYKWLRWTSTSQPDAGRIYANARDITGLRKLRDAHRTLQSLIDASPHAIVAVDSQRNVRIWNPAATRIFGWTSDEVVGG